MTHEATQVQHELRGLARKFAEKEIAPWIEEDERLERFRPEVIQKLGDLGLTGIPIAEALGGAGLGYQEYICVIEEIAACNAGYALSLTVTGLAQVILSQFGSEEQKNKYIPPLAVGKALGAFSLTEASSGSDAAALRTTAKKSGDSYILRGTKLYTTQGDDADTILLMARTGGPGPQGISAFILEKGMPGLSCGKRERKMGCHTSHTVELILEDVRVPAENLVGREGAGFSIAMAALDSGRITVATMALGIARAAMEVAVRYAKQREQFGRRIAEFQGVSFILADMATQLAAARLMIEHAARLKDSGDSFTLEAAMAKLFATDMAMQVTTDAVQVLGGAGYTQDFPVERYMREAKLMQIGEGTNQVQRMIIGQLLTQER